MRYPTITLNEMERFASRRVAGDHVELNTVTKWVGASPDLDLASLDAAIEEIATTWQDTYQHQTTPKARDELEGKAGLLLSGALAGTPVEVLDDPGFWRYVTARLWEFVSWREAAVTTKPWAESRVYLDGKKNAECVTLRMYLRGRIASDGGVPTLAHEVEEATDLWRSHIVRVRTSYSPRLTAGVLRQQEEDRMATDHLRAFAKRLNRLASNVTLRTYEDDEIVDELLVELRSTD